jgi:hypothetical protein
MFIELKAGCAILPWHAVVAAVEGRLEPVTTEKEDI